MMKALPNMDEHSASHRTQNSQKPDDTSQQKKQSGRTRLLGRIQNFLRGRDERDEDLLELVNARDEEDKHPLSPEEKALVAASLEFSNRTAETVSVPRADMVTICSEASFRDLIDVFASCQHSRLPVIGNDLDDVIGFITLKDLVKYVGHEKQFQLKKDIRPCTFVPDNLSVFKVLEAMRQDRAQMAIVVDEYGGTAGLVTLKDIIEVLVGEMEDEHETSTPQMLTPIGDNTYDLDPRLPIETLEEELGTHFTLTDNQGQEVERDFETAGGLVLALARKMPQKDDTFHTGNGYKFKVTQTDGRRIQKLELSYSPADAQAEQPMEPQGALGA